MFTSTVSFNTLSSNLRAFACGIETAQHVINQKDSTDACQCNILLRRCSADAANTDASLAERQYNCGECGKVLTVI